MNVLTPRVSFNISCAARALPDTPPVSNIDILQHFPRTANKSNAFHHKFSEKIQEDFGFSTRYWCHRPWESLDNAEDVTAESLVVETLEKIFSVMPPDRVQAFVLGSTTNKRYTGSQAAGALGQFKICAPAYDFKAGCSTSLAALQLAYALLNFGYQNVLTSCAETLSKVIDTNNEKTWFGLADGAASVWLTHNTNNPFTVLKSLFFTEGEYVDAYTTKGVFPPTQHQLDAYGYSLKGDETLLKNLALARYSQMLAAILPTAEEREAITWVITHQVNRHLIEQLLLANQLGHTSLLWDADSIGNIGGASILYTLARAMEEGEFNRKGRILMMSVGGGLSYAAQVLSFH